MNAFGYLGLFRFWQAAVELYFRLESVTINSNRAFAMNRSTAYLLIVTEHAASVEALLTEGLRQSFTRNMFEVESSACAMKVRYSMRWRCLFAIAGLAIDLETAFAADDKLPNQTVRETKSRHATTDLTDQEFAPPPVPGFMLEKPAQPLSMDEMILQAREAERRAKASQVELQRQKADGKVDLKR